MFDLMKMDLGTQQTEEIQNFYEKFSTQIKELFQQQENGANPDSICVSESQKSGDKEKEKP